MTLVRNPKVLSNSTRDCPRLDARAQSRPAQGASTRAAEKTEFVQDSKETPLPPGGVHVLSKSLYKAYISWFFRLRRAKNPSIYCSPFSFSPFLVCMFSFSSLFAYVLLLLWVLSVLRSSQFPPHLARLSFWSRSSMVAESAKCFRKSASWLVEPGTK